MSFNIVKSLNPEKHKATAAEKRVYITAYMFLLPAIIIYILFWIYPLINTIKLSFFEYNMLAPPKFIGLDNWKAVFKDKVVLNSMVATLKYTLTVVPSLIVIPLLMAILLKQKIKFISFFKWAYYLPYIISIVILSITWKLIYNSDGVLNSILSAVGLGMFRMNWLSDPKIAIYSIAFVTITHAAGYYMIIYLTGFNTISEEILEAAQIDGTNIFQYYWRIGIPMIKPQMLLVSVISIIGALKVFTEVYLLTDGGPAGSTNVMVYYIYKTGFTYFKMGYACAISVLFLLITLLFSILNIKILERE